MPIVPEPAQVATARTGSFYRAQCDRCGIGCRPRAMHSVQSAAAHARRRGWLVDARVLCPPCRRRPGEAAA